ncbi:MAG: DUF4433 domain-containing protein [Polyangia bacterium]|jgi:hypothetical protein
MERKIFHITHVDNLASIVADGELVSDATMIARGGPTASVGMDEIKRRRLGLPVPCHAGTKVGDYVPFYFCPRSVMLYVLHCANHPSLTYRGGQDPIVHLEADLDGVFAWAETQKRPCAFSLSNAGARYAEFRSDPADLDQVNWGAVGATDFSDPSVKEGKQAEFLVYGTFPWKLVSRVGVRSQAMRTRVTSVLGTAKHQPLVEIRTDWYY